MARPKGIPALPETQPLPVPPTVLEEAQLVPQPATIADVGPLWSLVDEASRTTTVLPRTRENICEHLRDFLVIHHEGRIVACGALALFTSSLAEIKSLVVAPGLRGMGLGRRIVMALVEEARRLGIRRVFALSDTPIIFEKMGFRQVPKDTLPQKVWRECIYCPKYLNCTEVAVELTLEPDWGRALMIGPSE
jgi:amino-acid N-acetyltransferase